jgi:hypothetical protein
MEFAHPLRRFLGIKPALIPGTSRLHEKLQNVRERRATADDEKAGQAASRIEVSQ